MTQPATSGLLTSLSSELAGVVERVSPSVVRVDDGSRLTATGILWSADGVVVTTSHGVERDEELAIELANGTRLAATVVGRDPDTDLAVLKVGATGLPAIQSAASADVRIGSLVLAMGRPGNSGLQATLGIISARLESQRGAEPEFVLHTDAVLYPGFSGGPLVDMNGHVVGLVNLMFGRGRGVALGIPIVTHVVEALLAHGRIRRGYLGVRAQQVALPESLVSALEPKQESALLIVQVEPGSAAEQGGLFIGDILLSINDHLIYDVDALRHSLRALQAGQKVALRLLRGGVLQDLAVTLGVEE